MIVSAKTITTFWKVTKESKSEIVLLWHFWLIRNHSIYTWLAINLLPLRINFYRSLVQALFHWNIERNFNQWSLSNGVKPYSQWFPIARCKTGISLVLFFDKLNSCKIQKHVRKPLIMLIIIWNRSQFITSV